MTPVEKVLAELPDAKKSTSGWSAKCPAHDDRKASLSVSEGDDGRVLAFCHAGCEFNAIVSALGLTIGDLMPDRPSPTPKRTRKPKSKPKSKPKGKPFPTEAAAVADLERQFGKPSELWTYHNMAWEPFGLVVRWNLAKDKKEIRPVSKYPDGWRIAAMAEPRPLYRLPTLAAADRVYVVEGEKCADAAHRLGLVATTSAGGARAARQTDWSPLAGKDVLILPDSDLPGRKYADTVAGILLKLSPAATVRILELPGLPDGGDLVDWIAAQGEAADPDTLRSAVETLAAEAEPECDDPPADTELRYRPFPVAVLPEPVRGFVTAGATAIGCDPSFIALPLLAAIAAAIGTTHRLELKRGWYALPVLWCAIVGESGSSKTPAFKLAVRPAHDRQRTALECHAGAMRRYDAAVARWEKEFAAWKRSKDAAAEPPEKPVPPEAERYVVSDTTVEALAPILMANPRGLLLVRDELAGWLGSFDRYAANGKGGADAANWLSMFNAEAVVVDRKTGTPRTIHVPQAAVSVAGGIQPDILRRVLGAEHRESGLAARLLLAWPPRAAKRWTEADVDPEAEAGLARLFSRLYDLQPDDGADGTLRPATVRLDAGAKTAWTAYYDAHATEQVGLTGDLSAAWSKLEEYAARLALVIHFIRWAANDPTLADPRVLDAASTAAGIALATWFKGEARRIYAMLDESDAERDDRRLADWIARQSGVVTARQVQQGCRWLKAPGSAEAALDALDRANRGRWRPAQPSDRGGRPTRVFELSQPSTSTEP